MSYVNDKKDAALFIFKKMKKLSDLHVIFSQMRTAHYDFWFS